MLSSEKKDTMRSKNLWDSQKAFYRMPDGALDSHKHNNNITTALLARTLTKKN
jgi:hypothetical protein